SGQNFIFAIILANDIQHVGEVVVVIVADVWPEQGLSYRTCRVILMEDVNQPAENSFCEVGLGRVVDFVASAIKDNTGMITIATDSIASIYFRPLVEVQVVIVGILGDGLAVEHFVYHEEAHAVAEVEELRSWGIMGSSDGIDSDVFEGA